MSILRGLGSFAKGALGGYETGLALREKIDNIKKKKQEEEFFKAGFPFSAKSGQDNSSMVTQANAPQSTKATQVMDYTDNAINQSDSFNPGLASLDYGKVNDRPVQAFKNGGMVRKYADGGSVGLSSLSMAADPNAISYQANTQAGLDTVSQPAPVVAQPINPSRNKAKMYEAMRDKAVELNRPDLFKMADDAASEARIQSAKENIPRAQRQYAVSGSIDGFVDIYNNDVDNGVKITGHEKTANGYKLKFNQNGQEFERELTPQQIEAQIYSFNDPAHHHAIEQASKVETAKNMQKANIEIAQKNSAPQNIAAGAKYVGNKEGGYITQDEKGNLIYPKAGLDVLVDNPKPEGNLIKNELDAYIATTDPSLPMAERAKQALKKRADDELNFRIAGRAPRAEREVPFEQQAYQDWAAEPAHKGQGKNQYLREKATWSQSEPLDSVTSSTEKMDDQGNLTRESRTSKVKPQAPVSPQRQQYLDAFNKYKGNPKAQAEVTALFRAKGIVK